MGKWYQKPPEVKQTDWRPWKLIRYPADPKLSSIAILMGAIVILLGIVAFVLWYPQYTAGRNVNRIPALNGETAKGNTVCTLPLGEEQSAVQSLVSSDSLDNPFKLASQDQVTWAGYTGTVEYSYSNEKLNAVTFAFPAESTWYGSSEKYMAVVNSIGSACGTYTTATFTTEPEENTENTVVWKYAKNSYSNKTMAITAMISEDGAITVQFEK